MNAESIEYKKILMRDENILGIRQEEMATQLYTSQWKTQESKGESSKEKQLPR
jgi:hypothetical protein